MEQLKPLIAALQKPSAYPHPAAKIKVIITAVSLVFLTGDFAYKVNKPLNLGFLDFSTLKKRQNQCQKELKYNRLISPEIYLNVVKINQDNQKNISLSGPGETIEYALKMKQMDPESTMNKLLEKDLVTPSHIQELARKIFSFHQIAPYSKEISQYGKIENIKFNWQENFQQTEKYKPEFISPEEFNFIQEKVTNFIEKNQELFRQRVLKNKIKHCHGDFHSGNIFIQQNKIYIFDAIVFNLRFPCSDIIAEIAFMAMDLDFHRKPDFSQLFIKTYQELSQDQDIPQLLNFYKCYRAYIRAKINCFTFEDPYLTEEKKQQTKKNAEKYFRLAKTYAELL